MTRLKLFSISLSSYNCYIIKYKYIYKFGRCYKNKILNIY